ncbi:MAG: AIM24 family protein [Lachnospira sp.]
MYNINIANTRNRRLVSQKGNISIFEYNREMVSDPDKAESVYYASQTETRKRQASFGVDQYNSVIGRAGALQWSAGQIQIASNYSEISEYAKQMLGDADAARSAAKHLYQGNGLIMFDATCNNLIIEDVGMWNGMVINDKSFYACNATVGVSTIARKGVDSRVMEGVFDTCLVGSGLVVIQSQYPREELIEVMLNNDELKVDGDYVVARSQSLSYTVERATNAPEDADRFVNVYRGVGKVLLAPL